MSGWTYKHNLHPRAVYENQGLTSTVSGSKDKKREHHQKRAAAAILTQNMVDITVKDFTRNKEGDFVMINGSVPHI